MMRRFSAIYQTTGLWFKIMTSLCGVRLLLFFFQAEDGIRDKLVTGVQTCALPISALFDGGERAGEERGVRLHRDPGAEGGPRPDQAREPPALEPARDAEGTQEEEEAEKKIALAGLPGAAGQMVRREDERAAAGGQRAPRRCQRGDRAGGGHQPRGGEDAPGEVAAAQRAEHGDGQEGRPRPGQV